MSCEQFFGVIPWPQFLVAVVIGFIGGAACGYAYGRHKTSTPSREVERARMDRYDWRAAYERVAPALVTFCILCSMFASVGVYLQGRTNRAQDVARTEDNTAFIKCLDDYTTALAGSLPPVRKASAARDAALSDALGRDGGLAGGFIKAARGDFEEADLKVLIKLLLAYTKADKALTKARAENPYPAPPSKFCALP